MVARRVERVNSTLREVISEVIQREVKHPHISSAITIMHVECSPDLHYAKVFVSLFGTEEQKSETIKALQSASGFIAVRASKKVHMRYFPELTFKLDSSVEMQIELERKLQELKEERAGRESIPESPGEEV